MPRRARVIVPGYPNHVVHRGNNRCGVFCDKHDYLVYLEWLRKYSREALCTIHAYVLMSNHVHILVSPAFEDGLFMLMKPLAQRYAQHFNVRYKRTGSLWEGRYHSSLIQSDEYLLNCYRYIEQNPVRAAMVESPGQYVWSSYRHNALGYDDDLITEHASYTQLGTSKIARLNAYRDMLAERLDDNWLQRIRKAHPGNHVLGDSLFLAQLNGGTPKSDISPALSFGLV